MKRPRYEDGLNVGSLAFWVMTRLAIPLALATVLVCSLHGANPVKHVGPTECYPDPAKTPGCALPQVTTEQVTTPGYTETARHVSKLLKWQVFVLYGFAAPGEPLDLQRLHDLENQFEIDHFVSLELGGSNDIKNLWPQPYAAPVVENQTLGARQKDVVETALHRMIARGQITLKQAQDIILTDWVKAYFEIKTSKPVTTYTP